MSRKNSKIVAPVAPVVAAAPVAPEPPPVVVTPPTAPVIIPPAPGTPSPADVRAAARAAYYAAHPMHGAPHGVAIDDLDPALRVGLYDVINDTPSTPGTVYFHDAPLRGGASIAALTPYARALLAARFLAGSPRSIERSNGTTVAIASPAADALRAILPSDAPAVDCGAFTPLIRARLSTRETRTRPSVGSAGYFADTHASDTDM